MPAGVSLGGGAHGGGHDLALCHLPLLHTARLQYVEHLGASTLVEEAVREEALAPLLAAASPAAGNVLSDIQVTVCQVATSHSYSQQRSPQEASGVRPGHTGWSSSTCPPPRYSQSPAPGSC